MLEAKEESIRVKNDLDKEVKERRAEIGRSERRIVQKEENLDKKLEAIEKREAGFAAKEEEINRQKAQVAKLNEERVKELERISGLTSEQAKDYLLKTVEEDVKIDTAKLIKEMEHKAKEEADKKKRRRGDTGPHLRQVGTRAEQTLRERGLFRTGHSRGS